MSTIFLVLVGVAFAGLAFIGYQYFHTKKTEQAAAETAKMQALMEAYRQRRQEKKDSSEEKPDIDELTLEIESLPVAQGGSLYWRKFWYIGLIVVASLLVLWMVVETQKGSEEKNLSQGLSQSPKAAEIEEDNHHDEKRKTNSQDEDSELQLLEMAHSHYAKQVVINGLVRNVSEDTLNNVTVVVIFEDGEENFLTSAQSQLVFTMFLPGEESPFKVETIDDHRMVGFKVNFRTHEGAPLSHADVRKSPHEYINPPPKDIKHKEHEEENHHEST